MTRNPLQGCTRISDTVSPFSSFPRSATFLLPSLKSSVFSELQRIDGHSCGFACRKNSSVIMHSWATIGSENHAIYLLPRGCRTPYPSIPTVIQDGGRRLEVVFHDGSRCGGRDFSMNGDGRRVAQLILAVGHTRDWSGRPLPVCR